MELSKQLLDKYNNLKTLLQSYEKVAVAFSSGVDSTLLLYVAREVCGDNVIAVTASSKSFPDRELTEAKEYTSSLGITHEIVVTNELEIEGFRNNPKDRCYLCKKEIFGNIIGTAAKHGIDIILEGSNVDDEGDYRPGMKAIKELGVKSPLREVRLTKTEIRELSNYLELPTWNKQSFACLATRFEYGELITEEKLDMVGRAEQELMDLGFYQTRVRIHGKIARIEINPSQFDMLMKEDIRNRVHTKFREYGFDYVTLDLMGYRTGSMNETLTKAELDLAK